MPSCGESLPLSVRRHANAGELVDLRAAWNELARGVPFRGSDWLEAWWRHYGPTQYVAKEELLVLAVNDAAGRPVGLAPWYLTRTATQGKAIRFLGSGEVCSDYLTVLARPGLECPVANAIADWLVAGGEPAGSCPWDLIELGGVHAADPTIAALVGRLRERQCAVHEYAGPGCWRIELPSTWDEYLTRLSKSHRKQLRRCQQRYFATGRARLVRADDEQQLARGLEILQQLHTRRWRSRGRGGAFASPRFAEFLRDVSWNLFRDGRLAVYWLEIDGRPAAAEYHVCDGDVVYSYQSGIEPELLAHQPGRLITMATLQRAIADGRRSFDFLRGSEPYKAHWRATMCRLGAVRVVPARSGPRLRHGWWLARTRLKNWVKTGLRLSNVRANP